MLLLYSEPGVNLVWEEFALIKGDDAPAKRAKRIDQQRKKEIRTSGQPLVRMKRLTLDIPEPLHRVIKKNAAEEGVTMAQKLRAILRERYRSFEEKGL